MDQVVHSFTKCSLHCFSLFCTSFHPHILNFFHASSHDVRRRGLLPEEVPRGLHEGLLPLLGVVPDLGGQPQDAHAVPGVDLGLAHGVQADAAHLAVDAVHEATEALLVAVAPLVLLVLVLLVLLKAGVAQVAVVAVAGRVLAARVAGVRLVGVAVRRFFCRNRS